MMRTAGYRRTRLVVIIAALIGLCGSGVAVADQPPSRPGPNACIDEFSDNSYYVGDGWPGAMVASTEGADGDDVALYCGDEMSGVVHIAHPESNGTVHPIVIGNESDFLSCWRLTVRNGVYQPIEGDRIKILYRFPSGRGQATAYIDGRRRFTYSIFTSNTPDNPPAHNDWPWCVLAQ